MIKETTDKNLWNDIPLGITLVDIWASYCGPCRQYTPVLEKWASDTGNTLLKINLEENPQVGIDHTILSIPTVLVFKDGELRGKLTGAKPRAKLDRELTELGLDTVAERM